MGGRKCSVGAGALSLAHLHLPLPTELSSFLHSSQTSGDRDQEERGPIHASGGRVCGEAQVRITAGIHASGGRVCGEAQVRITAGTWSRKHPGHLSKKVGDLRPGTQASVGSQAENGPCL